MYKLLVVVHILSVIAWVGAGSMKQFSVIKARKSGGSLEADRQIVCFEWMERLVSIPAPILVLATGVTMVAVSDGWGFSQPWVYLALALFLVTGVLGGAVGGRLDKRMTELRDQGGVSGQVYADTLRRALNNIWVEMALLVTVIFLMVYKPL
jgi:uncharacterized membrane protein